MQRFLTDYFRRTLFHASLLLLGQNYVPEKKTMMREDSNEF